MSSTRATWTKFFFSPSGRFARAQYWGATFAVYGVLGAYFLPLAVLDSSSLDADAVYFGIGAVLFVAAIVAHMFTIVKRFHDRDKPWPWCLVIIIPYIGGLWILIECGCMPGTDGSNSFGDDPRQRFGPAPGAAPVTPVEDAAPGRRDHSF